MYAHELNKQYPKTLDPARHIIASNGRQLAFGSWNTNDAVLVPIDQLKQGTVDATKLKEALQWAALQKFALEVRDKLFPQGFFYPYEFLGENRVRLAKVGTNAFSEQLEPLLKRFFQSQNPEYEDEIIRRAYVTSDDTTKYERLFETYLRDRVIHLHDPRGKILEPKKYNEPTLTEALGASASHKLPQGQVQLIIGAVGAGKSIFLKRYFAYLFPEELKRKSVICRLNFNEAPEDLADLNNWISTKFVDTIRKDYSTLLDLTSSDVLRSVFNVEIRDNKGAYDLLRGLKDGSYERRLAQDLLSWMGRPDTYAKALARNLAGERGLSVVVIFDNVDRREREAQLRIFQTAQWFRTLSRAYIIICLRDETFENYKTEKPLDAYINTGNFYIRPPRFVDMIRKRLDLAIEFLVEHSKEVIKYDIPGLGIVSYPRTDLGKYLNAIYLDLFRSKRNITIILEGLAGKNVRKALEMFSAILISKHLEPEALAAASLLQDQYRLQEITIIRALMRTSYVYFFGGHGFIQNIFDFAPGTRSFNHFVKFELLEFLTENRKKVGDVRYEGYFSVAFLVDRLRRMGFDPDEVVETLKSLLVQGLIVSERFTSNELNMTDSVRIHAGGFIHARILVGRVEYIASAALVTPIVDKGLSAEIGRLWQIHYPHIDIKRNTKTKVGELFRRYIEVRLNEYSARNPNYADNGYGKVLMQRMRDGIGFSAGKGGAETQSLLENEFDRLFN